MWTPWNRDTLINRTLSLGPKQLISNARRKKKRDTLIIRKVSPFTVEVLLYIMLAEPHSSIKYVCASNLTSLWRCPVSWDSYSHVLSSSPGPCMCHRCRGSEEVTTQVHHWSKGTGTTRHPDQDRCVRWEGWGDDGRVEEGVWIYM